MDRFDIYGKIIDTVLKDRYTGTVPSKYAFILFDTAAEAEAAVSGEAKGAERFLGGTLKSGSHQISGSAGGEGGRRLRQGPALVSVKIPDECFPLSITSVVSVGREVDAEDVIVQFCGVGGQKGELKARIAGTIQSVNLRAGSVLNTAARKTVQQNKPEPLSVDFLLKSRKLVLILDLDQTLVHAVPGIDYDTWLQELATDWPDEAKRIHRFRLVETGNRETFLAVREGVVEFLELLAKTFELVVYTAGVDEYAQRVGGILDPNGNLLKGRLFGKSSLYRDRNGIDWKRFDHVVPGVESLSLVVDDTWKVWNFHDAVVPISSFYFFPPDPRTAGAVQLSPQQQNGLTTVADLLQRVCIEYFEAFDEGRAVGGDARGLDVGRVIAGMRSGVLQGCSLVLSQIYTGHLECRFPHHPLVKAIEKLGGTVTESLDHTTTHLVLQGDRNTLKVDEARRRGGITIVDVGWVWSCIWNWNLVPEEHHPIKVSYKPDGSSVLDRRRSVGGMAGVRSGRDTRSSPAHESSDLKSQSDSNLLKLKIAMEEGEGMRKLVREKEEALKALQGEMDSVKLELTGKDGEFVVLKRDVEGLESEIERRKNVEAGLLAQIQSDRMTAEEYGAQMNARLEELTQTVQNQQQLITTLQSEAQQTAQTLTTSHNQTIAEIHATHEAELTTLQTQLSQLRAEWERTSEEQSAAAQASQEESKARLDAKEKEVMAVKGETIEKEAEWVKKFRALEGELSDARKESEGKKGFGKEDDGGAKAEEEEEEEEKEKEKEKEKPKEKEKEKKKEKEEKERKKEEKEKEKERAKKEEWNNAGWTLPLWDREKLEGRVMPVSGDEVVGELDVCKRPSRYLNIQPIPYLLLLDIPPAEEYDQDEDSNPPIPLADRYSQDQGANPPIPPADQHSQHEDANPSTPPADGHSQDEDLDLPFPACTQTPVTGNKK
ncbi:hypothetical protein HDV00_007291 [Rhizophlyctis rosea]|nr:hypothetical protein HDV00_007291 [Rhizophlyctis rosea]